MEHPNIEVIRAIAYHHCDKDTQQQFVNALLEYDTYLLNKDLPKFPEEFRTNERFIRLWKEFTQHRKQKGKFTAVSMKRAVTKLTTQPVMIAIEMLDTAIDKGWTTVYVPAKSTSVNNGSSFKGKF